MSRQSLQMELLGERLHIEADDGELLRGIRQAGILLMCEDSDRSPQLTFTFNLVDHGSFVNIPSGTPRAVSEQNDFEIFSAGDEMVVVVDHKSTARCRFRDSEVHITVHPEHRENSWILGHRLFFIPLLEWMRYRNWYPIHGSCFQVDGRTIVVSGPSGSGKSTAALSAIASGCPFLSDDTLFARREGTILRLDAYPEPVKIGKGSAEFFPEWGDRFTEGMGKLVISENELPGEERVSGATPDYLLFPEIVDSDKTSFEPVGKETALIKLMPQSVLPEGPEVMQRHIDLLGELVEQTETYHLLFGRDVRDLPDRIRSLL